MWPQANSRSRSQGRRGPVFGLQRGPRGYLNPYHVRTMITSYPRAPWRRDRDDGAARMSRRRNRRERQLANQIAAQIRPDFQRIEGRIRGTALGVGWLYRPQPPLQRRDIRVSGGTRDAIRAGGNIEVPDTGAHRRSRARCPNRGRRRLPPAARAPSPASSSAPAWCSARSTSGRGGSHGPSTERVSCPRLIR